jgi:pimeloyl-ACP methyl ester carboxylesterase
MAVFGLVHGAWHGAWCWELLVPELESRGHSAIAVDLPCEDREATFVDYAETVVRALGTASDVVLVGHSMAGMTIPLVALSRPVRLLVFLAALVPERPGERIQDKAPPTHPDNALGALVRHDDGSSAWPSLEAATRTLYQDCVPELAARAFARLRRQQSALWDSLAPFERWPHVPVASIHCEDDRAINPAWSRWIAPRRLGVQSRVLPGGHSPMLSRPSRLAETLIAAASEVDGRC